MPRPSVMPDKPFEDLAADNAFVLLVRRLQRNEVAIERVIDALLAIEKQCGVELVAPELPFVVIESESGVKLPAVRGSSVYGDLDEMWLDQVDDHKEQSQLFPFLTRTWALLWSRNPEAIDLVLDQRYFLDGTMRGTAHFYAEWANKAEWLGLTNWRYTTFYLGQGLTEEFCEWLDVLHTVVVEKTKLKSQNV